LIFLNSDEYRVPFNGNMIYMTDRITKYKDITPANEVYARFQAPMAPCKWKIVQNSAIANMPPDGYDLVGRKETIWELRDRFLNIAVGDKQKLLQFLDDSGEWRAGKQYRKTTVSLASFWADQILLRELLLKKPRSQKAIDSIEERLTDQLADDWRPAGLKIGVDDAPAVVIVMSHTRALLFLSVWLDLVSRSEIRYCARVDCPTHAVGTAPFRLTSKHQKIYCSTKCAKLEMVRRFRSKKKNPKE
jgi:hypothetical protein